MRQYGYQPCVKGRSTEARDRAAGWRPRRWVVEAAASWMNRFRKLHVRYEKTHRSYLGLCMLAAAIIALNKTGVIYG